MRMHLGRFTATAGLLVAAAVLVGCQGGKDGHATSGKPADTTAVPVVASAITVGSFEDWASYSADLRGIEDATLSAPYQGGRVTMVREVGTRVSKGQSLCSIELETYEAALEAARAQAALAKSDLERAQSNVEKGSLGRSALDGANLGFQNARMVVATAQRAYEDCRCQAPFDGILVSRSIDLHQTVAPGMPTVRLSRIDRLEAVVFLPETEAFSYSEGMKAEFHLLQDPTRIYQGKISSLDRAVNTQTRTVTARIAISNAGGFLKPGMVGRARILRKAYASGIVVPSVALLRLQSGLSAMVVENGIARQRRVRVEATSGDSTLVTEGLADGDVLITSGAFQVSDGTRVTY